MKTYTSIVITLLFSINLIFGQCIDNTLIDPLASCSLQYDPICGCNGKNYQNACFAQITDGILMGSPGTCPMDSTYTVCEGESIQIGLSIPVDMAQYNWNPPNALSCSDCYNPVTTPAQNMMYELEIVDANSTSSYYYYEVMVDNNCPVACIDSTLIDPNAMCTLQNDPVCGCNGKTYSNSCFAEIQDGITSWNTGACLVTESYTICAGDSIQIGLSSALSDVIYTWQPTNELGCIDCENTFASPAVTSIYELSILSNLNESITYQYYEVIVDTCVLPCKDVDLIDTTAVCDAPNDAVCGCDGRTYANACLAEKEGGLNEWSSGACPTTQSYSICVGDSIQIGLSSGLSDVIYTWQTTSDLSCIDCENTFASPVATSIYELSILSNLNESITYQYYEVIVDTCVLPCKDVDLIDTTAVCVVPNDAVCGCDGRTYANACLAEKEGGLNEWLLGACPITENYTICTGDSVQIGLNEAVSNTVLSWQPDVLLSCSDCPNPYASPIETTLFELETFSTTEMTYTYTYYQVSIDENCSLICTNNEIAFSYEKVAIIEEGDPITNGANQYCFNDISNVDDDCQYIWYFDNGGSSYLQNPCNIKLPYIKNGSPVQDPIYNVCLTVYTCDGTTIGTCCQEILSEAPICECENTETPVCGVNGNTYPSACVANCKLVDVAYAGTCCDINNLPWLEEALPNMCNNCVRSIEFIEYDGSNYIAFWADDANCYDALSTIYNCDGSVFCSIGGIDGLNECSDLVANHTVIEYIWEKSIYCGVCGFDKPTEIDWLLNFSDGSYSVNTYKYNNETVFYFDNCNSGLNYVTTCDSTFVCGWGGNDNLSGEGCPDFLSEAEHIEEIIPCACIDLSLLNPSAGCPPFSAPVCGCDGVTYSNFCFAQTQGGVTSWTAFACPPAPCIDTVSIANTFLSSGTYEANLVLQVSSKALKGHSLNFKSGKNIELLKGFDLPASSNLNILNSYCN